MTLRLIALFTGFCMLFTAVAMVPARAEQNSDAAKLLTGAIALFVLGNILANELEEPAVQQQSSLDPAPTSNGSARDTIRRSQERMKQNKANAAANQHNGRFGEHRHKVLPTECSFYLTRGYRETEVFGADCLEDHVKKSKWLPEVCERQVRIRHGRRSTVYDADCLRDHGWRDDRVARWRR